MSGVILATGLGAFGATAAAGVGTGAMIAAGIGAGTTLYGGAKSFSNANKARKRGEAAERAADKAIEEARRRVDVNAYEQLSIAKEPYELMRDALLTAGATGLQSGVEGETRGAAATAGRIQMAQNLKQGEVRAEMGQQMDELNRLVADEDKRRQQQLAGQRLPARRKAVEVHAARDGPPASGGAVPPHGTGSSYCLSVHQHGYFAPRHIVDPQRRQGTRLRNVEPDHGPGVERVGDVLLEGYRRRGNVVGPDGRSHRPRQIG